jgi:hypothetical protein
MAVRKSVAPRTTNVVLSPTELRQTSTSCDFCCLLYSVFPDNIDTYVSSCLSQPWEFRLFAVPLADISGTKVYAPRHVWLGVETGSVYIPPTESVLAIFPCPSGSEDGFPAESARYIMARTGYISNLAPLDNEPNDEYSEPNEEHIESDEEYSNDFKKKCGFVSLVSANCVDCDRIKGWLRECRRYH